MGHIWGLLTHKWAGPIATALALAFFSLFIAAKAETAFVTKNLGDQVVKVTGERDTARRDLTQCQTNSGNLQLEVDGQNRELDRLKAEADARRREAAAAVAGARTEAERARRSATAILNTRPTGEVCAAADSLILGSVR